MVPGSRDATVTRSLSDTPTSPSMLRKGFSGGTFVGFEHVTVVQGNRIGHYKMQIPALLTRAVRLEHLESDKGQHSKGEGACHLGKCRPPPGGRSFYVNSCQRQDTHPLSTEAGIVSCYRDPNSLKDLPRGSASKWQSRGSAPGLLDPGYRG